MASPERGPARVLLTGAGGPAAVGFIEAVAGPDVELFAVDIDPADREAGVWRGR